MLRLRCDGRYASGVTLADDASKAGELLERQIELLVAVATGNAEMNRVKREYQERRDERELALRPFGLRDPFPWEEPARWHAYWKAHELQSWASRREYIAELAGPVRARLREIRLGTAIDDPQGPAEPSWPDLGQRLEDAKDRFATSSVLDDYQDVGRRCREILIDLAGLVYSDAMLPTGQEPPKGSDAKARLGYAIDDVFQGQEHAELRKLIRAAWDLAGKVVHGGIADIDAFAVLQATVLLVRVFQRADREPRT